MLFAGEGFEPGPVTVNGFQDLIKPLWHLSGAKIRHSIYLKKKIREIIFYFVSNHLLKHLSALNKYFWKYPSVFYSVFFFVVASNYFATCSQKLQDFVVSKIRKQHTCHCTNNARSIACFIYSMDKPKRYFLQLFCVCVFPCLHSYSFACFNKRYF